MDSGISTLYILFLFIRSFLYFNKLAYDYLYSVNCEYIGVSEEEYNIGMSYKSDFPNILINLILTGPKMYTYSAHCITIFFFIIIRIIKMYNYTKINT